MIEKRGLFVFYLRFPNSFVAILETLNQNSSSKSVVSFLVFFFRLLIFFLSS